MRKDMEYHFPLIRPIQDTINNKQMLFFYIDFFQSGYHAVNVIPVIYRRLIQLYRDVQIEAIYGERRESKLIIFTPNSFAMFFAKVKLIKSKSSVGILSPPGML